MSDSSEASDLEAADIRHLREIPLRVRALGMFDMEPLVQALTTALLTEGHVLLEGNPGLGKTALARNLSRALRLGEGAVGRIQFTPDLMPADITGTLMPSEASGRLEFRPGPIFCNLLLADEINRATPKTQAAMLEAMAESQVTVLGETHPLRFWREGAGGAYRTPFMVMATQNPIDQEGTYALPEAQSDRFMFKLHMSMPKSGTLKAIVAKELGPSRETGRPEKRADPLEAAEAMARLHLIAEALRSVRPPALAADHIVNVVQAANGRFDEVEGVSRDRLDAARKLVEGRVAYPLGPRAATAMAKAAVGWSAVALVAPEEAAHGTGRHVWRALAQTALPVLRHRLQIAQDYADLATPQAAAQALDAYLGELLALCAPEVKGRDYPADFRNALKEARRDVRL